MYNTENFTLYIKTVENFIMDKGKNGEKEIYDILYEIS